VGVEVGKWSSKQRERKSWVGCPLLYKQLLGLRSRIFLCSTTSGLGPFPRDKAAET
jgi:hypothetical protein